MDFLTYLMGGVALLMIVLIFVLGVASARHEHDKVRAFRALAKLDKD
jgi:hypothetical protein